MNDPAAFQPFGPVHGATVAVAALMCILLPLGMRACGSRRLRLRVGQALGVALLGHEVLKTGLLVLGYGLPLTQSLPLHLCGVSVFLTAWVLLGRKYRAYEVVYFWGLGGSVMALATPDLQHDFPHPLFISFFVGHTLVLLGVTYATVVYGFRPLPRSLILAMVASLAYLGLMFFLNLALGTNYLYLRAKPTQPSLLDYLGPWPWYIVGMVVMGAAVMLLCYAPFAIGNWCRRRREAGWA
jgi:hypothetical integral membrane protein (TIGR02206 family)